MLAKTLSGGSDFAISEDIAGWVREKYLNTQVKIKTVERESLNFPNLGLLLRFLFIIDFFWGRKDSGFRRCSHRFCQR